MDVLSSKAPDDERNYAIDILRIISMLFVIVLHITIHGMKGADYELLSFPYWFVNLLRSFCNVAVNCFVLISGVHLTDYMETPARFLAQAGIALFTIAAAGLLLEFIRRMITKYICKIGDLITGR